MNINLNNYEAYFLDHLEGTLSSEQEKELQEFLEIHPELKYELDEFSEVTVAPDLDVVYKDKASLKKAAPVVSFSKRFYYYAAAAAVAILMTFIGISQFDKELPQPAGVGNGLAKFDITKGINKIVDKNRNQQQTEAGEEQLNNTETLPDQSSIAKATPVNPKSLPQQKQSPKEHQLPEEQQVPQLAKADEQHQEQIIPQEQQKRNAEVFIELEPKKAVAIENNENKELDIKWDNTLPIEPEQLWADNNVKSKSNIFKDLIHSGADLGLLPTAFASDKESTRKTLPNITIEVPASSNKILDLLFKN